MAQLNGHKVASRKLMQPARRRPVVPRSLGEVVAQVFEHALRISRNPKRAAVVAALVVQRALARAGQKSLLRRLSTV